MFAEEYKGLVDRFRDQVECDREKYEMGIRYLPNFTPSGPVDYILIAMEPSTGGSGRDEGPDPEPALNSSWSVEDFILHYCVREYLCRRGETYHITDLAKGSMPVKDAESHRQKMYESWYPLLRNELALLHKHLWNLPIPEFDPKNKLHTKLAKLSQRAETEAKDRIDGMEKILGTTPSSKSSQE